MSLTRIGGHSLRAVCSTSRILSLAPLRSSSCQFKVHLQSRSQHNRSSRPPRDPRLSGHPETSRGPLGKETRDVLHEINNENLLDNLDRQHFEWPKVKVRYLRPAIWAIVVSGGIFTGLAYLQAKQELKPQKPQRWLEAPQWGMQRRTAPTPTEVATQWWSQLNPISKLSCGIIATNSVIHLSSFLVPRYWDLLWHTPARNVNYTQFSSMFVHSGPFHLFVNMYFTYNFMIPVGYSRAFEGNPYHVLSFFLATGVLSGFAQHWATLITPQKRAIPEIFIRCGGASGALLGVLGVFCMQYPNAGLGLMFIPVHFDAQYVLPAIMLFDFVGMVRGYSFVNFGHAAHLSGTAIGVAYSYLDGKNRIWKPLVRFWKQRLQQ